MLDKNSDYVKKYLQKIEECSKDLINQDYSNLEEHIMPWGTTDGEEWTCRAIKTTTSEVCLQNFYNDKVKELILDENILSVSIHKLPPKSSLTPHIDPATHQKNVWRLLLPVKSTNYFLKRSGVVVKLEVGKTYAIDHTYEVHSSWNESETEEFIVWIFDIFYEDRSNYNMKNLKNKKMPKNFKLKEIDHYMDLTDLGSLAPKTHS